MSQLTAAAMSCVLMFASSALAQDHSGHAKHHDQLYKSLKQPGTGMSCCNNQDCRPVPHRITTTGVEFFVHGRWLMPPARVVMEVDMTSESHWCGVAEGSASPITYCAIVPRGGV